MALNEANLKDAIKSAFESVQNESSKDLAADTLADNLAKAIHNFVKEGKITVLTGEIQVQGTAAAQQNTAPLVITGGIS